MNLTYNTVIFNSSIIPNAWISFNGTNTTATVISSTAGFVYYSVSLIPPIVNVSASLGHIWYVNLTNLSGGIYQTNTVSQNQTINQVGVSTCSASHPYAIVNFTYLDEIDNSSVTVTSNNYLLSFYDGTYYYNLTGSFTSSTRDAICTNLPPSNYTYNWGMFGDITLQSPSYVTRKYTLTSFNPISVSNNPPTRQDLFMIKIDNSSTITYNWFTTESIPIDGILEIYKCNADNSKSLTESIPIVNSVAVANIQLLFQQYSYEVIYNGVRYNNQGFSTCHVEDDTAASYYVDVSGIDITPAIGLLLVDCKMTKIGTNQVQMNFSDITGENLQIEGCMKLIRTDMNGQVQDEIVCENGSSKSFTHSFSIITGNDYIVSGILTSGNNTGFCRDTISFYTRSGTSSLLGTGALLSIVFLILGTALMFSTKGETSLLMASGSLVLAFFIGLFALPWVGIISLISFSIIIIVIGRYSRKG